MCDKVLAYGEGAKVVIMSPVAHMEKGRHEKIIEILKKEGLSKARIDGEIYDLDSDIPTLDKNKKHSIEAIIDRIKLKADSRTRLYDSIESACKLSDGRCVVSIDDKELTFSEHLACPECEFSIPKLEPTLFSFNSPQGACDCCHGIGYLQQVSIDLLVPDDSLSINQGGIRYYKNIKGTDNIEWQTFAILCKHYNISLDTPWKDLTDAEKDIILHGSKEKILYEIESSSGNVFKRNQIIEGVQDLIERRYVETTSSWNKDYYGSYMMDITCPKCNGKRLSDVALSVKVGGLNIDEMTSFTIGELYDFLKNIKLNEVEAHIANLVLKEINNRLGFLVNVGLDYLTLNRQSGSLSGGELQRIRLATQIGSHLTGVLYVLDEPSIGLHERDNDRLISALKEMRDIGNTLIVVEHDEEIMRKADYLVDIGPGAGIHGGEVVAQGTPDEVAKVEDSITGQYLSKKKFIPVPSVRRLGNGKSLKIIGAKENNLKNIDVEIPLGKFVVVSGVSGSGKSTLVNEILVKYLKRAINKTKIVPGKCDTILGIENLDKIVEIDQSPIGRTPRSNPATYTSVFDDIRDIFASTVEAKMRGYNKGRFSFNVKGGRCEKCSGDGVIRIEMNFLPDVYVPCEECHGTRYNSETLEVKYKDKNIYDVLEMPIEEAYTFFESIPSIKQKLGVMNSVGLGYVKLGQSATTLSGGEAQRVKLASELYKRISPSSIFVLDEPTTGLHSEDVRKLLAVLNNIVDSGGTVVVIEHNLDVIKQADYIIDLGPEGGNRGGEVVAKGTPEEVSRVKESYTGAYLKKVLK